MNPIDTQLALKQRLLLAVSTGALLAAPACGSTSRDPDDSTQPSNRNTTSTGQGGAGGTSTSSSAGSETTTSTTTAPSTGATGGAGSGGVGTVGFVGGVGGVGGVGTVGFVGGVGGVGDLGGAGGEPNYTCELGALREFCLSPEMMEDQARYGPDHGVPRELLRSDEEIVAGYDENGCMRHDWIESGCCNPALGPGKPGAEECCYVACEGACCGRPLVLLGQAITAPATSRSDWVTLKLGALGASHQTPAAAALAELWQADALAEHASVASFARFTLQLLALGAPSELVRDAQLAALDEVDHARRCFDIASRLSGRLIGPGRLAEASAAVATDLAEVVVATIHEGCIGETLAAAMASEQARVAQDPEVRASLLKIAEDEARHAELAWRFVAWAVQRADTRVRRLAHEAFRQALARSEWPSDPARSAIDRTALHAWGQLSPEESQAVARQTLTSVVSPAAERLLASGDRAVAVHADQSYA